MNTAKAVYELVKALPEVQANMVLEFAESLHLNVQVHPASTSPLLSSYSGLLKDSPNLKEAPVEIQQVLRNEWA